MTRLPSNNPQAKSHPIRNTILTVGILAVLGGGAIFTTSALSNSTVPANEPTVEITETPEPTVTPTPTETPSPEPTVEAPPAPEVPAPPAPPPAPVKCPPGTVPGAVDDYGNESNCAPPCYAYNDDNICTSPGAFIVIGREAVIEA